MMKKSLLFVVVWALVILVLSGLPGHDLPNFTIWDLLGIDKVGHFTIYSIFAFLMMNYFSKQDRYPKLNNKPALFSVIIGASYGIMMELCQAAFFIDRSAEIGDAIANTIGCLIGIGIFRLFHKKIEKV